MADAREVQRLEGLRVDSADFAALVGPSGSDTSTLLKLIGLLDPPADGELTLRGEASRAMDDESRTALRGRHIDFVFQFHHRITAFTALENVLMQWMVANGRPDRELTGRAPGLLAELGLEKSTIAVPTSCRAASSNAWPCPRAGHAAGVAAG